MTDHDPSRPLGPAELAEEGAFGLLANRWPAK